MTEKQARRACRMYYLDCLPVGRIAQDTRETREAVLEVIDDPAAQAEYLRQAEQTRKRTKVRAAQAAELALEKQVEFLNREVTDELIPTQQATARALYGAGIADQDDRSEIRISFTGGDIRIGMPRAKPGEFEGAPYVEQDE